jgi:hypothetical protein
MADAFSEFYSGSMLAPNRVPGVGLVQAPIYSPPTSPAEMYAGMYGPKPIQPASASLTSRPVKLVAIDATTGNPVRIPGPSGSVDFNKDLSRMVAGTGLAFAGDQGQAPGVAAINAATAPRMSMRSGSFFANGAFPFLGGDPGQTDYSIANGGDNGVFGLPAQGFATAPNGPPVIRPSVIAAPAPKPKPKAPATMASNLNPGISRYLSEQGGSDKGMTAGEQANAFRKAMGF